MFIDVYGSYYSFMRVDRDYDIGMIVTLYQGTS